MNKKIIPYNDLKNHTLCTKQFIKFSLLTIIFISSFLKNTPPKYINPESTTKFMLAGLGTYFAFLLTHIHIKYAPIILEYVFSSSEKQQELRKKFIDTINSYTNRKLF